MKRLYLRFIFVFLAVFIPSAWLSQQAPDAIPRTPWAGFVGGIIATGIVVGTIYLLCLAAVVIHRNRSSP